MRRSRGGTEAIPQVLIKSEGGPKAVPRRYHKHTIKEEAFSRRYRGGTTGPNKKRGGPVPPHLDYKVLKRIRGGVVDGAKVG